MPPIKYFVEIEHSEHSLKETVCFNIIPTAYDGISGDDMEDLSGWLFYLYQESATWLYPNMLSIIKMWSKAVELGNAYSPEITLYVPSMGQFTLSLEKKLL